MNYECMKAIRLDKNKIRNQKMTPIKKLLFQVVSLAVLGALVGWSWGTTASDRQAYDLAKGLSVEKYRTHVLSIFGKGTEKEEGIWYVNFYDPDSPTKGKVVIIEKGVVTRSHAAAGRGVFDDNMSFDPTLTTVSAEDALKTAQAYAVKNQIVYDSTRMLLRRTAVGSAPIWRVELLQEGRSKGYVLSKAEDGSFASYLPPPPVTSRKENHSNTGAEFFGKEVEKTFTGIGADLEEFFTGERTVD
ncbi:MAG: hypothetical protein SGI98_02330 [Verrucomicrobiota bacterium]|nr:hypothetical protein [Verrucomicrobiota bacterium]